MQNLVDRWGPAGYEPSGGPQRPNPLGMLPAWLVELILGGMAPPAPPPMPRRGIPGVNGGMLPMRRPYQDPSYSPPRSFPPRG